MRVCACIERAEQLSAFAALAQGPCSIASTHTGLTTVCNSSSLGSDAVLWPLWTPSTHMVCRHTWRQTSHAHKIKNKRTLCVTKKKPLTRSKETGKGQSQVGKIRRHFMSADLTQILALLHSTPSVRERFTVASRPTLPTPSHPTASIPPDYR